MAAAATSTVPTGPNPAASATSQPFVSKWSSRYRGATVQDLDPPAALSLHPSDPISLALLSAFERDYTHLTITDRHTRALLGYLAIPHLQALLDAGKVGPDDELAKAMVRFQRKGRTYKVITMQTPLEELEAFFEAGGGNGTAASPSGVTALPRPCTLFPGPGHSVLWFPQNTKRAVHPSPVSIRLSWFPNVPATVAEFPRVVEDENTTAVLIMCECFGA
ncbi:hypothetical protein HYQ44_003080 [Verticillium longisporum]|nr:hypothetical protein HYQ44_003080 [Verticillium longisporum]